jgi:hypothetical protein
LSVLLLELLAMPPAGWVFLLARRMLFSNLQLLHDPNLLTLPVLLLVLPVLLRELCLMLLPPSCCLRFLHLLHFLQPFRSTSTWACLLCPR